MLSLNNMTQFRNSECGMICPNGKNHYLWDSDQYGFSSYRCTDQLLMNFLFLSSFNTLTMNCIGFQVTLSRWSFRQAHRMASIICDTTSAQNQSEYSVSRKWAKNQSKLTFSVVALLDIKIYKNVKQKT